MAEEYCSQESRDECEHFDIENLQNGSMIYNDGLGRFGNHFVTLCLLMGIKAILEKRGHMGLKLFTSKEGIMFMKAVFTEDSLRKTGIRNIETAFCNKNSYFDFPWSYYGEKMADFVEMKELFKGRLIHVYPVSKTKNSRWVSAIELQKSLL